jgi:hypothetical protein
LSIGWDDPAADRDGDNSQIVDTVDYIRGLSRACLWDHSGRA